VSIDLNMDASLLSKRHYDAFSLAVQQINTSVFNNLAFTLTNHALKPEILIFNPPYVPVEQEEIDNEQKYLA
jgi:methylase of polypeptide subunit release factors